MCDMKHLQRCGTVFKGTDRGMLLTGMLLLNDLMPVVPAAVLLAPSVPYFAATLAWHGVSAVLPRRWFRYVDDVMYETYQRYVLFFFENVADVQLVLHGDVDDVVGEKPHENVLYIANHQCTVDWVVADMIAARRRYRRRNALGYLRYMLKDTLQYVPLYGWYFHRHGCVYVRRGGNKFRSDITCGQLDALADMDDSAPVWLVIFPEGTRYSTQALTRSRRHAEENGWQPLRQVLTPRVKGVHLALDGLLKGGKKKLDAVYDVTVAYGVDGSGGRRPPAPSMFQFVCGPPGRRLDVHLTRIPVGDVPSSESERASWLYELFAEKDRLLTRYYRDGEWDMRSSASSKHCRPDAIPLSFTLPAALLFTSVTACLLSCRLGRKLYAFTACFGSVGCVLYMKLKKAA